MTIPPDVQDADHSAPIHLRINAAQAVGRYALCGERDTNGTAASRGKHEVEDAGGSTWETFPRSSGAAPTRGGDQ